MPLRGAHHVTGLAGKLAEDKGVKLSGLSLDDMRSIEPRITDEVFQVLTVEASVASRLSFGGTAPTRVREAVKAARERFL